MRATLHTSQIKKITDRLRATTEKTAAIGDVALDLIRQRFASGGASGGEAWPKGQGQLAHSPPLAGIESTFHAAATDKEVAVSSSDPHAAYLSEGTVGKGGLFPTIEPTKAKSLAIPLTEKGRAHLETYRQRAPVIRTVFSGMPSITKPDFKQAKFTRVDDAKVGVDFIFAKHADFPPRHMLPTSDHERETIAKATLKILKD